MAAVLVPAPVTVVGGVTVFTKDLWNNGPALADAWLRDPPRAILAQTVSQSIPTGVDTPVAFDQVIVDNRAGRSSDGTAWSAPAAGIYLVTATSNLAWNGAAGAFVGNHITATGQGTCAATEIPATPGPARFQYNLGALIALNAGDAIQLRIFQNSGQPLPTGFSATGSRLNARWIASP
ncbi:hypothetical protein GCM10009839_13900 [Catenulispora yoronensis]|uniref:C1q domain-containing protein n=1 Tax=Catenulispora yoronensis TaxID=450799 RepID=A0ABN2TSW7_9ACTN